MVKVHAHGRKPFATIGARNVLEFVDPVFRALVLAVLFFAFALVAFIGPMKISVFFPYFEL